MEEGGRTEPARLIRRAAIGIVAFLLLAPFFGGWLAYSALRGAVEAFGRAEDEMTTRGGDVEGLLRDAIEDTEHAQELLADPAVRALGAVTATGDDLVAGRQLAGIAGDAIAVGLDVWLLLEELGPDLYPEGRIDFATVEELDARLTEYSDDVAALQARLATAEKGSLGVMHEAYDEAERRVASAESALETASRVLDVLPELFGRDHQRRYLVTFLTPTEARGGGGLLGVFCVLTADDGRLELAQIRPNDDINDRLGKEKVPAPAWFDKLYGGLTALNDVRQANLSVSFPATSRVMLEMYREVFGKELDGLIAMDPLTLGNLSKALGPLRAEGWNRSITPSNARRLLLRDIYKRFPLSAERRQNLYLAGLVDNVWTKINNGDFPIGAMGAALAGSAATQHLKMFVAEPSVQNVVRDIGIGGDPTVEAPNVQVFFHNNFAGSKLDYFIDRTQTVDIELTKEGSARVVTEVQMANDVPTEPVSVINQPLNRELPVGLARMTVHFLLPEGAHVTGSAVNERRTQFFRGVDSGLPARWTSVNVESGASTTLRLEYEIEDAFADDRFEFTLWPQALPFADHFSIAVAPPPGASIEEHNAGRLEDGVLYATGRLRTPRTFTIEW